MPGCLIAMSMAIDGKREGEAVNCLLSSLREQVKYFHIAARRARHHGTYPNVDPHQLQGGEIILRRADVVL